MRKSTGLHHACAVYAKQVTQGKLRQSCCKWEILACQRHLDDLKRQGTDDFPWVFDETRADRIVRWFLKCPQVRGPLAGQPIRLLDWQVFDLGVTYGWVHRDTGVRRFNRTYNKRGRGNVKSTEKSGQCLYHMCADVLYPPYQPELAEFEMEPEVECAAVDREQAKRVYGDAKKIGAKSPAIAKRMVIKKTIAYHRTRGGLMRPLSKDTKNKDSGAPSYFVVDEYHAHETSEIYDLGFNSFGKRRQPLLDVITTAGDDAAHKPCYKEEQYCKRVLQEPELQAREQRYFIMIREIDDGDNPHDKRCWVKANPILRGHDLYAETLRSQIESEYVTAYESGDPEKIRKFLTRRMCRWQAASVNRYFDERLLTLARAAMVPRAEFAKLTDGKPCHCGYDLGKRVDLTGAGAVWALPDGRFAVKMQGFLPENRASWHEKTDRVQYLSWAENGYVTLTPGDVTDNSYVNNWICEGEREHGWQVEEIDYDGHNATDLAIQMREERGEDKVVEIAQTCAGLNQATKRFRELLLQGKLVIEYSPLALWCMSNAIEVVNNFGDIKLSKRHKDDSERIDPLAATLNALARLLVRIDQPKKRTLAEKIAAGDFGM